MSLHEPDPLQLKKEPIFPAYTSVLRRAEDWERLTRLEYIVEALAKEHEKQSQELSIVVKIQRDMMSHLKTIKWTIIGGFSGWVLSQIGLDKTLDLVAKIVGLS